LRPLSETVPEAGSVSLTLSVPVPECRKPDAWNLTVTVHDAPGASPAAGQLLPDTVSETPPVTPEIPTVSGPVLPPPAGALFRIVTFCVCAAPPTVMKVKLVGETESLTPFPLSATGELVTGTLAVTVSVPLTAPAAFGENTTLIVHELSEAARRRQG
jgi:hypothetical protein